MAITVTATNILGAMACEPIGQVTVVEFTVNLDSAATHPLLPFTEPFGSGAAVVQLFDGGGAVLETAANVGLITCLDIANQNLQFLLGSTGATGSANVAGLTGIHFIAWIAS